MNENQLRLLRYALRFTAGGDWSPVGEDALPDVLVLEDLELVEVNEEQTRYRIALGP